MLLFFKSSSASQLLTSSWNCVVGKQCFLSEFRFSLVEHITKSSDWYRVTTYFGFVKVSFIFNPLSLSWQIHKQAPPLEDIAEDCSLSMLSFLKRALERNPSRRSSASELLKDEAINPPREDQPRCWSLDSALEEVTLTLLRQQSENHSSTQGMQLVWFS